MLPALARIIHLSHKMRCRHVPISDRRSVTLGWQVQGLLHSTLALPTHLPFVEQRTPVLHEHDKGGHWLLIPRGEFSPY